MSQEEAQTGYTFQSPRTQDNKHQQTEPFTACRMASRLPQPMLGVLTAGRRAPGSWGNCVWVGLPGHLWRSPAFESGDREGNTAPGWVSAIHSTEGPKEQKGEGITDCFSSRAGTPSSPALRLMWLSHPTSFRGLSLANGIWASSTSIVTVPTANLLISLSPFGLVSGQSRLNTGRSELQDF